MLPFHSDISSPSQHPLVRTYSLSRTQDERALMSVSESLPVLCIHGSEDQHIIAANHERFMKQNFGNVEYHTIPLGHTTFWEEPEKINVLMLAWIKKVSQVSASDDVYILVV